ncbi:MAG: hypothetical protein IPJ74_26735 [Saprospiraceae bacterium]|nr:hypothetical protein [Saprospiraceae bacterium]
MSNTNPFRLIVRAAIWGAVAIILAYIGLHIAALIDLDYNRVQVYNMVSGQIESVILTIWDFIRPFLQIVILLAIVDWIFRRVGIDIKSKTQLHWNAPAIIAFVVIGAFALAALTGMEGASYMKDVVLVVVGFYFGTQRDIIKQVNNSDKTDPEN